MIRVLVLSVLILACAAPSFAKGSPLEIWPTLNVEGTLSGALKARLTEEARINASGGLYYYRTDLEINWQPSAYFEQTGAGYRVANQLSSGAWTPRNQVYLYGTARWKLGDFRLDDRNMIDYQLQASQDGHLRYRNRVMLSVPLGKGRAPVAYLSDEMFFAFNNPGLRIFRNRINLGLTGTLATNLTGNAYLQSQTTRNFDADEGEIRTFLNAVGLSLSYRF